MDSFDEQENREDDTADQISLSPLEEPSQIAFIPADPVKISKKRLQEVWPIAVEQASRVRASMRDALKERIHALSVNGQSVILFVDDQDLLRTLRRSHALRTAIASALSAMLDVPVQFEVTGTLTLDLDSDDNHIPPPPPPSRKNIIDRKAQSFFTQTKLFSVRDPDPQEERIHSLPV